MVATMDPMIKWIGGASAAIVLALGTATVAGSVLQSDSSADEAVTLDDAIPVDRELVAASAAAPRSAAPAAQAVAATAAAPAGKPAGKPAGEAFVIKRILPIEGPMKYGEWHWNTEGAPATGQLIITVDLEARVMSVFRDGYEIGAAVAMLGTKDHPTPLGTFPILRKQRHNVSEKYGNAPMPYSMFLTRDGIAIHGGNEVENGYASHGCIAIPDELAAKVFEIAKPGDKVIITKGKRIGVGDPIIS